METHLPKRSLRRLKWRKSVLGLGVGFIGLARKIGSKSGQGGEPVFFLSVVGFNLPRKIVLISE